MEQSDTTRQKIRDDLRAAGLLGLLEAQPRHDEIPQIPSQRYRRITSASIALLLIVALALLVVAIVPNL